MANLAAVLLGVGVNDEAAAYKPGELLFDALQSDAEFDAITIDVSAETSSLPQALALLATVQLAVDAAAAAVEYRYHTQGEPERDDETVLSLLRDLVPDFGWELEVVELSSGSIKGTFRKLVQPNSRKKIVAVATLTAAVITAMIPAVGWVAGGPGVAVGAIAVGDAFWPDKPAPAPPPAPPPAPEATAGLADQLKATQEQLEQLKTQLNKTTEALAQVSTQSVDKTAVQGARVEKVQVTVANQPQTPPE
jgi:hypothetical protein